MEFRVNFAVEVTRFARKTLGTGRSVVVVLTVVRVSCSGEEVRVNLRPFKDPFGLHLVICYGVRRVVYIH